MCLPITKKWIRKDKIREKTSPFEGETAALKNVTFHLDSKQFSGIDRGVFRKYGRVTWLKDGTPYDPATDGKDVMVRGFEINDFHPDDAGVYLAHVKLENKKRKERCNATVVVEMIGMPMICLNLN
jgi:hypothetical protein